MSDIAAAVRERPIIFSAEMVRAIIDGRKTQTRRPVIGLYSEPFHNGKYRPSEPILCEDGLWRWRRGVVFYEDDAIRCPYGLLGDRLWVRETWSAASRDGVALYPGEGSGDLRWPAITYAADGSVRVSDEPIKGVVFGRRRSPIHMPRWASRLTLEIIEVRVQRVQEISEEDCRAEGCYGGHLSIPEYQFSATPREHFRHTWNSLNEHRGYSWAENPWVWAITFRRIEAAA